MKSKIALLTKDQMVPVIGAVEAFLQSKKTEGMRLSKMHVVATLASRGLCSFKSSGVEHTLVSKAKELEVPIPPLLAELIGLSQPPASSPVHTTPAAQATPAQPSQPAPMKEGKPLLLGLKAVSHIMFPACGPSTTTFIDGTTSCGGNFGVSELRLSCSLIEFSAS